MSYPPLGLAGNKPVNRSVDFVDNNNVQMKPNNFNVPPLINQSNFPNKVSFKNKIIY